MAEPKEVTLPSGAVLRITPAPFAVAKDLYQAVLRELRFIPIQSENEFGELLKNIFTAGFSSKEIERLAMKCMERCTYDAGDGQEKFTDKTFEPVEAREDYSVVFFEVVKENINPFAKSLWREYQKALSEATTAFLPSKSATTQS